MGTTSRPCFFLRVFLLLFFTFNTDLAMAADTISITQSLSGNQTIISEGGNFELGFFTPGPSKNYYIGIWYKKIIPVQTVIWVANRETPLPDTSSQLKISEEDGNLVLSNHTKITTWSSNSTSKAANPTIAVLLNTGNLVLRDESDSSVVIWQSFDHPTDTWMPGCRIGLNKLTGHRPRLISWRNLEDPAPGAFSLQIEEDGVNQFFMLQNNSHRYWSSGVWDGHMFSAVPGLKSDGFGHLLGQMNFSYVSNENENYFTYSFNDASIILRAVMDTSGLFDSWLWSESKEKWDFLMSLPGDHCEVFGLCGSFGSCSESSTTSCTCLPGFRPLSQKNWEMGDWSSGCIRETDLHCSDNISIGKEKDVFQVIPNMRLPVSAQSLTVERAEECKLACLDDCSCTAYAYNVSSCYVWSGDLLNLRQLSSTDVKGEDLFLRLAAAQNRSADKVVATGLIIGGSIGVVVSLVIVLVLTWRCRRKLHSVRPSREVTGSLVPFLYRDLRSATKDFAEKIGGGSFGSVFKGTLADSSVVAVKKLEGLRQGEKQFRSEVSTIGMVQHVNLIRLRGFCCEGSKRLLVYDFMPNGSLDSHLFGEGSQVLAWKMRYQIALGIAKGLAYLHEKCRECIVHCDIKPENILLDGAFSPKVADFGMAKLIGRDFSRVLTTMRGTIGYLAPEWIQGVAITAKADVYSYGMMVLEIISGTRNTQQFEIGEAGYFPLWAAGKIKEGDVLCLLDQRLGGDADMEELTRACRVACWCIQENEASRPSMGQVVQILEGVLEVSVPPIPRFLQNMLGDGETATSSYTESKMTKNPVNFSGYMQPLTNHMYQVSEGSNW